MIKLALSDLRESWLSWAGVSLAFIAVNFAFALSAMMMATGLAAPAPTAADAETPLQLSYTATTNLVLCTVVGLAVLGSSTALVVTARRGAVARLLLAGADPGQVVRLVSTQLVAVSLAAAVVADLIAVAVLPAVVASEAADRGFTAPPLVYAPLRVLGANLACAAVAVVGGWRQSRAASLIPPVEALRQSVGAPTRRRAAPVVLRWVGFAGCVLLMALVAVGVWLMVPELGERDGTMTTMQASMFALVFTGFAISVIAPVVMGPLVRAWTAVVPARFAAWHLARETVVAKSERLSRSVVPVMFSVGLVFGMSAFLSSSIATVAENFDVQLGGASVVSVISMIGLVLLVAVAGSVGSLVMMSKQRDAELALAGIVGATPGQQASIPVLEGVIVTVTGTLLGLAMTGVTLFYYYVGTSRLLDHVALTIPWPIFWGTFGVALAVTCAAILAPTIGSLSQPAPRVIARLVAE